MSIEKAKVSVVVPIFGDSDLADDFCCEVDKTFKEYFSTNDLVQFCEVIFVCDGNKSDFPRLAILTDRYPYIKIFELSRNFGHHIAIACGYFHARGDVIVLTNVDQQDPPSQIPHLLSALDAPDNDIAYGVSECRETSLINKYTSFLFTHAMNALTGYKCPANVTTLRAMKRPVVEALNQLVERQRYLPGLEGWVGYHAVYVQIKTQARLRGSSSYTFFKRLKMAGSAIISFSDIPLRLVIVVGFIFAIAGLLLGAYVVGRAILSSDMLPGYASIVAMVTFLGGVILLSIGMSSLYIGRILTEVQARPLYLIRRSLT